MKYEQYDWTHMPNKKTLLILGLMTLIILLIAIKLIVKPVKQMDTPNPSKQTVVNESELNTVHLQDNAYRKLGIQIASIKREKLIASKVYGGDVVLPPGSLVSVTSPISGKLISLNDTLLKPGAQVKLGQLIYRIQPIITADARANLVNALADAEGLVNVAKSQRDATEIALNRANKMLQDLVGSQRNVDEANAANQIALGNLETAIAKKNALHQVVNQGTVEPIDIKSPQAGIVSNIFAVKGQLVSAGNPVIDISTLNALWVRVPVPAGDLNTIDQAAEATIQLSSATSDSLRLSAKPIKAPPTADPLTSSTHLYYAIQNELSALRPMQRVSVSLNTHNQSNHVLTLPWSAVVFDINGGSWVYIQQSNNVYARKRVFLDHVTANQAILSEGPPEGTKVVVNGALELFGVETGFSH